MKPESWVTDPAAAASASVHLDDLAALAHHDPALCSAALKFQLEHAAAEADYDFGRDSLLPAARRGGGRGASPTSPVSAAAAAAAAVPRRGVSPDGGGCAPPLDAAAALERQHVEGALRRMLDFALLCGSHALAAATRPTAAPAAAAAARGGSICSDGSVDDLLSNPGGEGLATVAHLAAELLGLVFLVSRPLRPALQRHALGDTALLPFLRAALTVDRAVELAVFAEGFKTAHLAALANFTYGSRAVCDAVCATETALLPVLLGATRIDEENPGMVEWAEFCIRNLCTESGAAREALRSVRPSAAAAAGAAAAGRAAAGATAVPDRCDPGAVDA